MSNHLKFYFVALALFFVSPIDASSARPMYDEEDPQCEGGEHIDENTTPLHIDIHPKTTQENVTQKCQATLTENMRLEKENKNLKKENEKLKETTAELRTKVKCYESQWFWTWIFLAFVVGGVPGFFLGRGGRQSQRPNNNTVVPRLDNGLPKCPRCGMEHDPGDTVCKNPNCKTQF